MRRAGDDRVTSFTKIPQEAAASLPPDGGNSPRNDNKLPDAGEQKND